jgi:uncharacterized protein YjbK
VTGWRSGAEPPSYGDEWAELSQCFPRGQGSPWHIGREGDYDTYCAAVAVEETEVSNQGAKEVELKLEVDGQAAVDALARAAGGTPEKPVRQLNTFFDDAAGRLSRARYALRLRDEGGTFLLTAKGPQKQASTAVSSRPEEEREIDAGTAARILEGKDAPLDVLGLGADAGRRALLDEMRAVTKGAALERIGSFENVRTRLPATLEVGGRRVAVVLEMDRTTFPGGAVHHEVEVELPGGIDARAAEAAVRALFAAAGVAGTPAPSKAQRFFAALEGKAI